MAKILIKAGAEIDVPTRAEVRQDIYDAAQDVETQRLRVEYRGIKPMRVSGPVSPAATTYYIANGPEVGYLWSVQLLSVQLASAGTVLAYVTSSAPSTGATPQRLVANMSTSNANQVQPYAKNQCPVYPAESIYLVATQNITAFYMSGWEVPAEMVGKLL